MISSTTARVPEHTADHLNEQIRRQTEANVACCAAAGTKAFERRLAELDQEWHIERTLEAKAAMTLTGSCLGLAADRRFFALPVVVAGFLLQHAVQGWRPPVPLFRRLGFRTPSEIDHERYALKAIGASFRHAGPKGHEEGHSPEQAVEAARR